jgi:hypothetical protein
MRRCKFIDEDTKFSMIDDDVIFLNGNIYQYSIEDDIVFTGSLYYYIYTLEDSTKVLARWSKKYFDKLFIDIQEERKLKIKKLSKL